MIRPRAPQGNQNLESNRTLAWSTVFFLCMLASWPSAVRSADDQQPEKVPAPKADAPKTDTPKADTPKADEVKKEQVKEFLQNLFPGRNGGNRQNPRRPGQRTPSNDGSDESRDPVESRVPRDAKTEQLVSAASNAARQKNWKAAVELYQRLLDQPEDSVHRVSNGRWQSVRQTINEKLAELPEKTLDEYRAQYSGLASQQLAAARRSGRIADFVSVATRFFHTPAGYDAAQYLAGQHVDRSEFELAARWYAELTKAKAPVTTQDSWLLQAALVTARAGERSSAETYLKRLSQGPETVITIGDQSFKAAEWLNLAQQEKKSGAPALQDWMQAYGIASRTGTAVGGDPLLSPLWSLPLTSSHVVRGALKWLVHDLQDQHRATILAAQPLVVDGKVIYRDLRGLRCVDIEQGQTIWEGVEGVSPERIIGGVPSQQIDPQDAWRFQMNAFQNLSDYQGLSAEFSPLASFLFRDGTYGLISSDGQQIFVIEDHGILSSKQPGQQFGWDGNADPLDPFGVPWKSNRLVSYDLRTGRALWSVGGTESHEAFELPLAGSYFYGTPVVDGNELFVVAGKGDDIRLWALDRKSGTPLWSQLIAYSDSKIDLDVVRRWVASQVSVGSGIIVCPTTVGWLVAIDRMRQSVLWAYRYSPRTAANQQDREVGGNFMVQRELNAQWCPSAPIISGNRVIFAPQDEPILICLNAVDGRRIWQKPKENGLYVAGVFNDVVLIAGDSGMKALNLADGQTAWSTEFDADIRPSGRGVVVGDRFYLPLSGGELQAVSVTSGQVISQTYVGSRQPPLGNLAMHQGKFVSLGLTGLTVFGQREATLTEIERRLSRNPDDAWALLRSGENQLLNHQYAEALPLLRRINLEKLTPAERTRQHAALFECLSTLVLSDVLARTEELDELGRMATSPAEKLAFHQMTAQKLITERKAVDAFRNYVRLADSPSDEFVALPEDRDLKTRFEFWLSGRLSEIWAEMSAEERSVIEDEIAAQIVTSSDRDQNSCRRVANLFSFHPASISARRRLVEWLVTADDLAGARLELQRLIDQPDQSAAAIATERMAQLMIQSQLPDDAVYYYQELQSRFGELIVRDGQTGTMLVEQARERGGLNFEPRLRGLNWKSTPLRLEQSVTNYSQPPQEVVRPPSLPYFEQLAIDYYQHDQRIALESVATSQFAWMVPLRGAARANDDGYISAESIGHQLYLINRGVLHAVSPIEKRILWTKSLDSQIDGNIELRNESRPMTTAMLAPGRDDQSLLLQRSATAGNLAVVQPDYLCLYGRRSLSILDPRTGEERWQRDDLPMNASIIGTRDMVFAVVPGKSDVLAFRISDGKQLAMPGLFKLLGSAIATHGSSLLLFDQGPSPLEAFGIRRPKTIKCSLRLFNLVTRANEWQMELPAGTLVSPLGNSEVIATLTDGRTQRIDLATGRVRMLESATVDAALLKRLAISQEKFLLADEDQIYLIVNQPDHRNQSYSENLSSVRAHGTIFAWNRHDNRFLWSSPIEQQNLVVDRFSTMPVLLFVSRSWRPRQRMDVGYLNLQVIHKQTGKSLFEVQMRSVFSGFHALLINGSVPSIELRSYNARMRLVAAEGTPAPAAVVDPP